MRSKEEIIASIKEGIEISGGFTFHDLGELTDYSSDTLYIPTSFKSISIRIEHFGKDGVIACEEQEQERTHEYKYEELSDELLNEIDEYIHVFNRLNI